MISPIQKTNLNYKSLSRFNVFFNGKLIAKNQPYQAAFLLARTKKGAIIKFASFGGAA